MCRARIGSRTGSSASQTRDPASKQTTSLLAPLAAVPVFDRAVAQPAAAVRFALVLLAAAVFSPVQAACLTAVAVVMLFARAQAVASCSAEAVLSSEDTDASAACAVKASDTQSQAVCR